MHSEWSGARAGAYSEHRHLGTGWKWNLTFLETLDEVPVGQKPGISPTEARRVLQLLSYSKTGILVDGQLEPGLEVQPLIAHHFSLIPPCTTPGLALQICDRLHIQEGVQLDPAQHQVFLLFSQRNVDHRRVEFSGPPSLIPSFIPTLHG
jgi:hypothetical protein